MKPIRIKPKEAHSDSGVQGLLKTPFFYRLFSNLISRSNSRKRYIEEFIKPFSGCRILDIGCGPADILEVMPSNIGEYVGFDMNPNYISAAKERWGSRGTFHCQRVNKFHNRTNYYDIVLATAIIHHLDNQEANQLFETARNVLKDSGSLITYDNVYIENQNWFARFMNFQDRGNYVRTPDEYTNIAKKHFSIVEEKVLHDTLRVPYTIFTMRCSQKDQPSHFAK